MDGKERNEFVWGLLQGDLVEKFGGIASAAAHNDGGPESELARRISEKLGVDIETTQRWIGELIAEGVLRLESRGNGLRWQWSDTGKLKLAGQVTCARSYQF